MSKPEYFFHLGMSKTGSTYLQKYVFPNMEGIKYIKKHDYAKYKTTINSSDKLLFSSEKDRGIINELSEIRKHRPNSKIIVVFREHFDWIKSKYKYYIRKFGYLDFKDYYYKVLIPGLPMDELYYTNIILKIKGDFPNNHLILTYRMFKDFQKLFFRRLHNFIGVEYRDDYPEKVIKRAFSEKQLHVIREFNRIYTYKNPAYSKKFKHKLHYKFRELLLHTVALTGKFAPVKYSQIGKELMDNKEIIRKRYQHDWQNVISMVG